MKKRILSFVFLLLALFSSNAISEKPGQTIKYSTDDVAISVPMDFYIFSHTMDDTSATLSVSNLSKKDIVAKLDNDGYEFVSYGYSTLFEIDGIKPYSAGKEYDVNKMSKNEKTLFLEMYTDAMVQGRAEIISSGYLSTPYTTLLKVHSNMLFNGSNREIVQYIGYYNGKMIGFQAITDNNHFINEDLRLFDAVASTLRFGRDAQKPCALDY